jgi:hypothetical protein
MMKISRLLFTLGFIAVALSDCSCETKTNQRFPKLEVPAADNMSERTSLDFGQVQVKVKSVRKITVRNGGNVTLTVDKATTAAPFGVETMLPLNIEVNATAELMVSFTPTEPDQRVMGKLVLSANDPGRPSAEISLAGQGVLAVAKLVPNPIDFGDVYVGESKKVSLTLTNTGSDDLIVQEAAFSATTPATVTGDLSKLKVSLGSGTSAQVDLTWLPTGSASLSGALTLTLDAMQGGTLTVPIKGQSIQSVPSLCFKRDGTGVETCANVGQSSIDLPMGSFCDNRLFPSSCTDGGFSGKFYLKNEGNFPIAYSLTWDSLPYSSARCDGGSTTSDFTFSNLPMLADGGRQTKIVEPTVKLPANLSDPKPWETAPVSVSYRASSLCREDGADQARVSWTRQAQADAGELLGNNRMPGSLFMTIRAASQLPRAVTSDWSCGTASSPATVPCNAPFFGASNAGDAPLKITKVELWEEFPSLDGGDAGGPTGGFFQPCVAGSPGSPCEVFVWDKGDGGDPNQYAPHSLNPTTNPNQPTQRQLGSLTFGPGGRGCVDAGAACPNTGYRIYAVVSTDDPYSPTVISKIAGYGQ